MGDIAVYAKGSARPTGGAGACALLIGPNAPVVFESGRQHRLARECHHSFRSGCRATHMAHVYDFYKPNLNSPYPTVDGQLSVQCFTSALDTCYTQYCTKSQMNHESHSQHPHAHSSTLTSREVNLSTFAAVLFHTPYVKLAQKSLARLYLNDLIRACPYIPSALAEKYKYV